MKTISLVAVKRVLGVLLLSIILGVALILVGAQRTQAKPLLATRTFTVVNNCGYTVYPGIYPASTYANGGWTMAPGASVSFSVPDGNIGRLWGRTGCNSSSPASCTTGSCGGTGLQCAGTTGYPNTSLFEWNMNAGGTDWYNVSYVDAIDNPIGVRVSNTSCVSPSSCSNSVLTNCPADLRSGSVCLSPCTRYNTDQYCCRGAYGTPQTCVVSQWAASAQAYVNNIHNYCPRQYAYAYDEVSGGALQTCPTGANYTITFCPSGGGGTSPTATPVGTGPTQRWESVNIPGNFIRHQNSRGRISSNVSPLADSQFVMVPGLANSAAVSFRSVNFPNSYLRHRNGEIWLDVNNGTALFRADATFYRRAGLANSAYVSFESYNFPGRYIRHRNWLLYNESGSGSLFNSDATFIQR
jgi:hypothetical protein